MSEGAVTYGVGTLVSTSTRAFVTNRDGAQCWLCGQGPASALEVAHQISAVNTEELDQYQQMNIIPSTMHLGDADNLILLCCDCHRGFDYRPPRWVMAPSAEILQDYLRHERQDYSARQRAARRGVPQPRTLPLIDPSTIFYQPYILHAPFAVQRYLSSSRWPKIWLGNPVTAIIKTLEGLICLCARTSVMSMLGEVVRLGVPDNIKTKVVTLVNLWDRADPTVGPVTNPPVTRSQGPHGGGPGGGAGGAGGKGKGIYKEQTGRREGLRHPVPEDKVFGKEQRDSVFEWLEGLPCKRESGEKAMSR